MKRFFITLLSILLFVGCSAKDTSETNESEEKEMEQTEESGIEVDKGLFNVELTLPSSLFDEEELTEIEAQLKEDKKADVTQNEDGSLSVKMSKKEHKEMMSEIKEDFMETITNIIDDKEFASIHNITYNNDFTEINMVVDQEQFENSFDGFVTLNLGISSLFYQAFQGKDLEKEKVTILLEDSATNEIFQEIIYPDVLDEMEDELE